MTKQRGRVAVAANKFCRRREGEVEEVVKDQDLAVAVWACSYADGGDGELAGDRRRKFTGHSFKDDRDGTGSLQGEGVGEESLHR